MFIMIFKETEDISRPTRGYSWVKLSDHLTHSVYLMKNNIGMTKEVKINIFNKNDLINKPDEVWKNNGIE